MEEEHVALLQNIVPHTMHANVVSGKWAFKHKFKSDGSLERYKAHWVLRGFTQRLGVDFSETFSPVVKPAIVHTVLSLALSRSWPIYQLDVKNAFLHSTQFKVVYYAQPSGFEDPQLGLVCCLIWSEIGASAWYSRFATHLLSLGFLEAKSDTSLLTFNRGSNMAYLLLYVDDIVLTASFPQLLRRIIVALQQEFSMKDLGELHHFLLLSQQQYMLDILDHAGMAECKPCSTPMDTNPKIYSATGAPVKDPSDYQSLQGHFSTSPSLGQIYPTLFSRSACICMTLESLIRRLSIASCAIFVALYIWAFSVLLHQLNLLSTLMLIGLVVPTLISPPQAM
jgi:hypothetical protein